MVRSIAKIARIFIGLAATIFLAETLFGCVAILGIGFDSTQDIMLDLSLTMAFPIFLISFVNRTVALIGLWFFFAFRWANLCLVSRPPTLLSPLDGFHSDVLISGIVLFSISYVLRLWGRDTEAPR